MSVIRLVADWFWKWLVRPFSSRYKTFRGVELPDTLDAKAVYLLGENSVWAAALLCPCGCKEIIQLSLLQEDSPRWKFNTDNRLLTTLEPSIWRTVGCRSHFFLRKGL